MEDLVFVDVWQICLWWIFVVDLFVVDMSDGSVCGESGGLVCGGSGRGGSVVDLWNLC